jgi:hypothetical protein
MPKEYDSSFCQLVVETTVKVPFITEKTAIPLFYMKPFLVASCKNYHKILQRMGYELYTEIFDYSFDSIDDLETRFEGIMGNLNKINSLSFDELKILQDKLYDKLLFNKNQAIKLASKIEYQLDKLLELYKNSVLV